MIELSREANAVIQRYLRTVAEEMRSNGAGEDEIEDVSGSLREQIIDIASALDPALPVSAITDAVAEMEGPEAFASSIAVGRETPAAHIVSPQQDSPLGNIALYTAVLSLPIAFAGGTIANLLGTKGGDFGGMIFLFGELSALVMGWVARSEKNGNRGMKVAGGLLVACFALLFLISALEGGSS